LEGDAFQVKLSPVVRPAALAVRDSKVASRWG
jgi:hypothetical protein